MERPPADVAAMILDVLFAADASPAGGAPRRSFPLAGFQEAAVSRAHVALGRWGGVVLADAVGLGKTYMALALIEEALCRGERVLVVAPAALRAVWRPPLRRLTERHASGQVHLRSHAQLSRGSYAPGLAGALDLVVVDEAHRFRNPRTRRYGALAELCAGARVTLLTATPINNGPRDLHSLLRLFVADDAFVALGVPSLETLLASDPTAATAGSADALRRVVREIVVRRNRAVLENTGRGAGFPERAAPRVVPYDDPEVAELAADIAALELAPYQVPTWSTLGGRPEASASSADGDGPGGGARALVRLALLKRLESGRPALARSVHRQLAFCRAFLAALETGRLLRPGAPGAPSSGSDVDPMQLVLFHLVAERWPPGVDADALCASVERDARRLRRLRHGLGGPDPKLAALQRLIATLAPERVVVFTEFRDTAEAIWRGLAGSGGVARIDGGGAWLGLRPAGRGAVVRRFAPRANGAAEPPARERVRVLIATDVLAEGMNLQDARHVVCYDLPWNPVRIMQRIGRIDRLGSPHPEVVPHLFLPAGGVEGLLGLTRRLGDKLGTIAGALPDDDVARLLARLRQGGATAAAALHEVEARQADPMEALRARWEHAARHGGEAGRAPVRALRMDSMAGRAPGMDSMAGRVPGRASGTDAGAGRTPGSGTVTARVEAPGPACRGVVLVRTAAGNRLVEVGLDGSAGEPGVAGARLLVEALETPDRRATGGIRGPGNAAAGSDGMPVPPTDAAADLDSAAARLADRALAYLRAVRAAGASPPPLAARDPAARVARRLRRAMAARGPWLSPALVGRADRTLQTLSGPLDREAPRRLRTLLDTLEPDAEPADLLARLEPLLGTRQGGADGPPARTASAPDPVVLAVLVAVVPEGSDPGADGAPLEVDEVRGGG